MKPNNNKGDNVQLICGMFVDMDKAQNDSAYCLQKIEKLYKQGKIYDFTYDLIYGPYKDKYYLGMPLSRLQQGYYSQGRCFASAITQSLCFKNFRFVIANLENRASLKFLDEYNREWENFEGSNYEAKEAKNFCPTYFHAFLVLKGEELNKFIDEDSFYFKNETEYVLDTTDRRIMSKNNYYDAFKVDEKISFSNVDFEKSQLYALLKKQSTLQNWDYADYKRYFLSVATFAPHDPTDKILKPILSNDIYLLSSTHNNLENNLSKYANDDEKMPEPSYDFLPQLD